ncbi:hypothetical protein BCF74_1061, partial [Knoellia remsis]
LHEELTALADHLDLREVELTPLPA